MGDHFRTIAIESEPPSTASDWRVWDIELDQENVLLNGLLRPLHDLRISMTDRCNLRCIYCMPRALFGENQVYLQRSELLTFEEMEHLARFFARFGARKIRLTSGEPLLPNGIEHLIEKLFPCKRAQVELLKLR